MKKRKFSLKNKVFPFPILIFCFPAYMSFLYGDDDGLTASLILIGLFLILWYFLGPDLDAPTSLGVKRGRLVDPASLPPLDANAVMQDVQMKLIEKRFREDPDYRGGTLALALGAVLIVTGCFALFNREVICVRANIVIALCALGLLALGIAALIRKLRRRKENRDRAAYPTPQVNMNYDHEAAADARVRALHQRLARLDEWLAAGMIDKEEFDTLRKKYLGK